MRKGLFWVISNIEDEQKLLTYTVICDKNGITAAGQPPYNSQKGNSFSHERTWLLVSENMPMKIRKKRWDYFPRGRVEVANGKVTVYYNPIICWPGFQDAVIQEFELSDFPVRFKPDYSKHYESVLQNLL